jgi:hypothetical protein
MRDYVLSGTRGTLLSARARYSFAGLDRYFISSQFIESLNNDELATRRCRDQHGYVHRIHSSCVMQNRGVEVEQAAIGWASAR